MPATKTVVDEEVKDKSTPPKAKRPVGKKPTPPKGARPVSKIGKATDSTSKQTPKDKGAISKASPLASCTSRMPRIGDVVSSAKGIAEVGAWQLLLGEVASVVEVDEDGDFTLRNSSGEVSDWAQAQFYEYAKLDKSIRFQQLMDRSRGLRYKMPTQANSLQKVKASLQEEALQHAETTRPLVHSKLLKLASDFLTRKQTHGSAQDKTVYGSLDAQGLICRLLTKRPLMFMTESDMYLLRDGSTRGSGSHGNFAFDHIGTKAEEAPISLSEYQSYEEMELSALIGMSVPTHFINSGGRANNGRAGEAGSFESKGVYCGLVGCRFERKNRMEWKHMIVTQQQNTAGNGYGVRGNNPSLKQWARLYGMDYFPTYDEAAQAHANADLRFVKLSGGSSFFDIKAYAARCEIVAEMFLAEANNRAGDIGAKAFCHVVGLGLGVWQVDECQAQIQADAYAIVIQRMDLPNVGEMHFSWFPSHVTSCGGVSSGSPLRAKDGNSVRIVFDKRDPAEKLPPTAKKQKPWLLVAQYAWDGNSYPGNEYWVGQLSASGDPAAASCSYIPELQNADVNCEAFLPERVHIVGPADQEGDDNASLAIEPAIKRAKKSTATEPAASEKARNPSSRVKKSFLKRPAAASRSDVGSKTMKANGEGQAATVDKPKAVAKASGPRRAKKKAEPVVGAEQAPVVLDDVAVDEPVALAARLPPKGKSRSQKAADKQASANKGADDEKAQAKNTKQAPDEQAAAEPAEPVKTKAAKSVRARPKQVGADSAEASTPAKPSPAQTPKVRARPKQVGVDSAEAIALAKPVPAQTPKVSELATPVKAGRGSARKSAAREAVEEVAKGAGEKAVDVRTTATTLDSDAVADAKTASKGKKAKQASGQSVTSTTEMETVMLEAEGKGLKGQFQNLVARDDIVQRGFAPKQILVALEDAEGLVNKAKHALLDV